MRWLLLLSLGCSDPKSRVFVCPTMRECHVEQCADCRRIEVAFCGPDRDTPMHRCWYSLGECAAHGDQCRKTNVAELQ